MHAMLLDMSHNAPTTVVSSLYRILVESAIRCMRYIGSLPKIKRPAPALLLGKNGWSTIHLTVSTMAPGRLRARMTHTNPGLHARLG